MLAGLIFGYFMLGCVALALLVFPHWRQVAVAHVRAAWHRWRRGSQGVARQARSSARQTGVQWAVAAGSTGHWVAKRWPWAVLSMVLLTLPAATVWWWSTGSQRARTLDAFEERGNDGNDHVAHLLRGEQLVPPPPLPPQVFMTAEVEVVRPMLSSADRRWGRMDDEFVQRLLTIFKVMKEQHGYDMALLEGYRSPERQTLLASQGGHVTNAGAWQSYHQYGLAADCAFLREGKLVISEKDPWVMRGYELYGQVAEQLGMTWGGRWRLMDFGHVELRRRNIK
ncbi:MAG: M15 family metallopeptidase [Burkholderiales bacterium]|nr:M15 family metallopeptidase [Burkholderiales bacterium]